MGIKNFRALLKKCPQAVQQIPLRNFSGKRIAVDAGNLMVIALSSVWRSEVSRTKYPHETPNMERIIKNWLSNLRKHLERFLISGVTPVYVFDGPAPVEKQKCQQKRRDDRKAHQTKYDNLMTMTKNMNPDQVTEVMAETIQKEANYLYPYSSDLVSIMMGFYRSLGIPVLQSTEESERLCANLCLDGYCSAVFTTDRDVLVHGCPIMITEFMGSRVSDRGISEQTINIIVLREIINGLSLSFSSFVDLCIMSGCDYNDNIPNVGSIRALGLLKEFRDIESIPKTKLQKFLATYVKKNSNKIHLLENPIQSLLVDVCRALFSRKDSLELIEMKDFINPTMNSNEGAEGVKDVESIECIKDVESVEGPACAQVEKLSACKPKLPLLSIDVTALNDIAPAFLSDYQLQNWVGNFYTLYQILPKLAEKDSEPSYPPDIIEGYFIQEDEQLIKIKLIVDSSC